MINIKAHPIRRLENNVPSKCNIYPGKNDHVTIQSKCGNLQCSDYFKLWFIHIQYYGTCTTRGGHILSELLVCTRKPFSTIYIL